MQSTSLKNIQIKFMWSGTRWKNVDEEGNITKKSGRELLSIDVSDKNVLLSKKSVFVGQKCSTLIRELGVALSHPS